MEPQRSDLISLRARAFDLVKAKSFKRGKFVLASGRESNFYLDMKPSMFDPDGASMLAQLVLERVKNLNADLIGGLELGAVPIVTAVAMLSAGTAHRLPGFFVRKEVKSHGTKKKVEAADNIGGKKVVILEDVTTTGGSAMQAVNAVREAGGEVLLVLSLVDREEGAAEFYQQQGVPFASLFRVGEFLAAA